MKFKKIFFNFFQPPCVFLFSLIFITSFFADRVIAADPSSCIDSLSVIYSGAEVSADGSTKITPGSSIEAQVHNNCESNTIKVNVYVYPVSLAPDSSNSNIESYKKVSNKEIGPKTTLHSNITLYGTVTGKYKVRVVSFLLNSDGDIIQSLGVFGKEPTITIATEGIVISGDSTTKQSAGGDYKIKIYNHNGENYSICIDGAIDCKISGTIDSDSFITNYHWDTSGTELGNHNITVVLSDGLQESYPVKIEADNSGSGSGSSDSGSSVSILSLNKISLKNLVNTCKAKQDLAQISCLITLSTSYLLDIAGVIAFIMIIYASIVYLTSYGDENKAELGKKTLIWSVIGMIIIGAGKAILYILEKYVNT